MIFSISVANINKSIGQDLKEENTNTTIISSKDSILSSEDSLKNAQNYELLTRGYNFINEKRYDDAITIFNTYLLDNPTDVKIHLQLAYLYDLVKRYDKAYDEFSYVSRNSTNPEEAEKAKLSMGYMKDKLNPKKSTSSSSSTYLDVYLYNFYDSYYKNYVANLLIHLNFRLANRIYAGPYLETYLDSKSEPTNIINDRFFDVGGFVKFNITDWMNFEVRVGYVREIDFKKSSLSFKPILSMGKRIGTATFYKDAKTTKKENLYMDIYSAFLYDYKLRNVFGYLQLRESLRFLLGGYSYTELYLKQEVAMDSKKFDFNNYLDLGAGVSYKPNLENFPTFFIEAVNRMYLIGNTGEFFSGDLRNLFTARVGFLFNYITKL